MLLVADSLYREGGTDNLIQAEAKYRDFLNRFPTSDRSPYVQFQIGNSLENAGRQTGSRPAGDRGAVKAYEDLLRIYPDSEYATAAAKQRDQLLGRLGQHEFEVGHFYLRYGLPKAAALRMQYLLDHYPTYPEKDRSTSTWALAERRLGNREEARQWFDKLRAEFPSKPVGGEDPQARSGQPDPARSRPTKRRVGRRGAGMRAGRRSDVARLAARLVLALALAGCSSLPVAGRQQADPRIDRLEDRIVELQRQATVNEVEIGRLRQQVAALETRLAARSGPAPPHGADGNQTGAADSAHRGGAAGGGRGGRARGRADDARRLAAGSSAPASAAATGVAAPATPPAARRPPTPAGPAAGAAAVPSRAPAPDACAGCQCRRRLPAPSRPQPVSREAQAIYDEAYTLYHQGRYVESETSFRQFLEANPATELSDNAQYWIGAARFAQGDYEGALQAFRETVAHFPHENKVPDAMYKMAQTLEQLGDGDGATEVYRELVQRFPDTAAAALAAEKVGQ